MDDPKQIPTSQLIRGYLHLTQCLNKWEAKNPTVSGLDKMKLSEQEYAAEIDRRIPING